MKKWDRDSGEVTVFVYDAAGKFIAEYTPTIAPTEDAKVAYLTNDHLGSPRVNTDANGAVTARHDYHPFGEEVETSQRVAGLGYADDTVRKQFTGYERDYETGLDFAQSRYMQFGFGRYTSPDSFTNDTRVSSPQSWNLYSYVRNNPLNVIDPQGKKGEVYWEVDKKGNVKVKLKGSFAIYGAAGQGVSKSDLKAYKRALVDGIRQHLTKTFDNIGGRSVSVEVDISAKVYSSEKGAIDSGSDNIVEIGYGAIDSLKSEDDSGTAGMGFGVTGENFDRMVLSVKKGGNGGTVSPFVSIGETAAHEFAAHLLRGGHNENLDQRDSLFANLALGDGSSVFHASDMVRLVSGFDVDSRLNTPGEPPPGRRPPNPLDISKWDRPGTRWANSRNNSSPSAVYTWQTGVKQ